MSPLVLLSFSLDHYFWPGRRAKHRKENLHGAKLFTPIGGIPARLPVALVAVSELVVGNGAMVLVITVPRVSHGTGTADNNICGEGGASAEGAAIGGAGEGVGFVVAVRGSLLMDMSSLKEERFRSRQYGKLTI